VCVLLVVSDAATTSTTTVTTTAAATTTTATTTTTTTTTTSTTAATTVCSELLQLSLTLLTSICRVNSTAVAAVHKDILPQITQLIRSPLLQGIMQARRISLQYVYVSTQSLPLSWIFSVLGKQNSSNRHLSHSLIVCSISSSSLKNLSTERGSE